MVNGYLLMNIVGEYILWVFLMDVVVYFIGKFCLIMDVLFFLGIYLCFL